MTTNPNHRNYDVVIVGARAAGAATAMLMARSGLRVLVIDRQSYGSDTLSSHALMRGAVNRLARWGLLESVWASGSPVIDRTVMKYGSEELVLDIKPAPGVAGLVAPRRTVLDPILVDAARDAGAEVLHETKLTRLVHDQSGRVRGVELELADGSVAVIGADLVVGADGLRSRVAREASAPITHQGAHASAAILRYYTDLPADRGAFQWLYQDGIGGGIIPTNDDAFCVFVAVPHGLFRADARHDVARAHRRILRRLDSDLASAVDQATPISPMRSFPGVAGQFRRPYGPGWALVGDAGYFKDPYAAHGITDAFRDAELLTDAVLSGDFAGYELRRDELSRPLFDVLDQIASHDWDLARLQGLHRKLSTVMKAEELATEATPQLAA